MARARNIKPGFFTNDLLAEVVPLGRLLFQGLWCHADREGRLEDRPKKLKAEILPYDEVDVDSLLNSLVEKGFIVRYSAGEVRFIQVLNFTKHQNPHMKEQASEIPAPDMSGASTVQASDITGSCPADSLNPHPLTLNPSNPLVASDAADPENAEAVTGIPNCPQQKLLTLYAELLPTLTQHRSWDGARADAMRARWRKCAVPSGVSKGYTTEEEGLRYWRKFFTYVAASSKLTNGIPRDDGTAWTPDLEWLMKAGNFAKVVEGKYHEAAA